MGGWISLHRKITKWEWFKTPNMYHLFTYMVLCANHEDNNWQGISIKKGQLITGINSLSQNTGISVQSVRTCLNKLKSTGEITIQSTNKYSIITICNYAAYQLQNSNTNNQPNKPPNKELTINQQSTNNKQEYNKDNKEDTSSLKEKLIKENPKQKPNPKERDNKNDKLIEPIDPELQKWEYLAKEYNREQIEKYPDEPFRRRHRTWEEAKADWEEGERRAQQIYEWDIADQKRRAEIKNLDLQNFDEWVKLEEERVKNTK